MTNVERTQVAIVGAGPAGLLLSHLLAASGIDSIVLESRTREDVENTIRAGILEQGTVDLLVETGASDRVLTVGDKHDGIELRFGDGQAHRIDFPSLVGRAVWLYPQHEVLRDLVAARIAGGQDLRFEVAVTDIADAESTAPRVQGKAADGTPFEILADVVVGADGSRSLARKVVNGERSNGYFREYPFAWFGILCEAPPSSEELIYSNSAEGFALISQRSPEVQRMYFQVDPTATTDEWTDEAIWETLQARVPGTTLKEGPIFQKDVLKFRSFVTQSMRKGRVVLVGDAAHTVPPTGAKGMNLAVNDVWLLHQALESLLKQNDESRLDRYQELAMRRIWKAQHFSWWMTSMLHNTPESSDFDRMRQLGELSTVVSSEAGQTYLAEAYTGWPREGF